MIRKIIITGISATAMTSVGWTAEPNQETTQERVGVASGAVLGGLAGGPLGVVLGAAFGGWLGDEFDVQRRERDDFEQRWEQAREEIMNCPRCTQDIPEGGRFCPACGLDLHSVSGEFNALEAPIEEAASDAAPKADVGDEAAATGAPRLDIWPPWLGVRDVASPKKPMLASTLAFFFGPFTYLYLEQAAWFWWGLLGGFVLILITGGELIPLLVIVFMLHAYDVSVRLNEEAAVEVPLAEPPEPAAPAADEAM